MVYLPKGWGGLYPAEKKNKLNAVKVVHDGIKFASKGEGRRYCELKLQQHCGVISELILQPKFILQGKCQVNGVNVSAIKYTADFQYQKAGETIVEDFKGVKTEAYGIRKRLFLKKFPQYRFLETGNQ